MTLIRFDRQNTDAFPVHLSRQESLLSRCKYCRSVVFVLVVLPLGTVRTGSDVAILETRVQQVLYVLDLSLVLLLQ